MAGKTIETKAPISIDALKEKVLEKFTCELFEHPEGYGIFEIARLKRHERAAIQAASRLPSGMVDVEVQNRMATAFGLVNPKITAEELKEYPDSFIEPIASRVWDLSNEHLIHAAEKEKEKGDGAGPDPFTKRSSSDSASAPSSAGPSTA